MLYILIALLACSDIAIYGKPDVQNIIAFPEYISFGHLTSGEETALEEFTIINSGQRDLTIQSPVLVSGNNRFSLGRPTQGEWIIKPNENVIFDVSYAPQTFEANGAYIEIASDDPDEPTVRIHLEGYGDAPSIEVTPSQFDYGLISIGCDNEERITIRNNGNMPLVVEDISQIVNNPVDILMEFGSLAPLPWIIEPGAQIDFLASYIPTDVGWDRSEIIIESNDPRTPELSVEQYGDGEVEQWHNQTYTQSEVSILDILWVIDDSGSMNPYQHLLANQISSFFQMFLAAAPDFNMSVITTTSPYLHGIINSGTPMPEIALANMVNVGIMGSGMEQGIEMAFQAFSNPTVAGPGSNFFRDEASLIVIFVSDERDWSPPWVTYTQFFDALKPAGLFTPYAVIGDYPNGCQGNNGNVSFNIEFGAGYWDLVNHYNGKWYSICAQDWGLQLQNLGATLSSRATYALDYPDPIEDTITVTVNGQITTDWRYDPMMNAITFRPDHVPEEGKTIEIDYAVWGC